MRPMVICCAIIMLSACGGNKTTVKVEKAALRSLVAEVSGPARIRPSTEVKISADAMGRVVEIAVKEGQSVTKDQLLLRLDAVQYEAQTNRAEAEYRQALANLDQQRAQLRQAAEELERMKTLAAKELVSREELDRQMTQVQVLEAVEKAAQRNIERAKAVLNGTEDQLARTVFRSPMNGTVSKVNVEEGEMAVTGTMNNPGTILLQIAGLDSMEAEVEIDETEVVDIRLGQPAVIELDAFPDTGLAGEVVEVSSSAEVQNKGTPQEVTNFPVVVALKELIQGIRPGMTATVRIETGRKEEVLSVPISSLVVRDPEREQRKESGEDDPEVRPDRKPPEKEGVYVVRDGKTSFLPLVTGISGEHYVEVLEGLEEDEEVVIGPFETLRELRAGTRVKTEESGVDE